MRKRNVHVQFWLDKKEAEAFNKKVKRSGLSREAYLRHLANGLVPQDAPPPAYYDFMRELHRIGGNLNQIAQKAHVLGVIDERRYDEEMRKFDQLVRDITKAVILPRRDGVRLWPPHPSGGWAAGWARCSSISRIQTRPKTLISLKSRIWMARRPRASRM